ncbi:hypothetical protein [Devosia sp. 2618]|uniref:hypothetical protein n=1 Tax=Devosia sp. 2618 TaxID=3156454 RepID=UPI0033937C4C
MTAAPTNGDAAPSVMMDEQNTIHEVEITSDGKTHLATYYVESGVVHAMIEGQKFIAPVLHHSVDEIVTMMMKGHYRNKAAQESKEEAWQQWTNPQDTSK